MNFILWIEICDQKNRQSNIVNKLLAIDMAQCYVSFLFSLLDYSSRDDISYIICMFLFQNLRRFYCSKNGFWIRPKQVKKCTLNEDKVD